MNLWRFKVWRLAWAREQYNAIGGWKHIWFRIWWDLCLRNKQPPMLRVVIPPSNKPPKALHWPVRTIKGIHRNHWCGADSKEPWCEKYGDVTCPTCKTKGASVVAQYTTSTR